VYAIDELEPLITWLRTAMRSFPRALKWSCSRRPPKVRQRSPSPDLLWETPTEVKAALAIFGYCPVVSKPKRRGRTWMPSCRWMRSSGRKHATGARYAVDNIWTKRFGGGTPAVDARTFSRVFPTPQSHVFIQVWGPIQKSFPTGLFVARKFILHATPSITIPWTMRAAQRGW